MKKLFFFGLLTCFGALLNAQCGPGGCGGGPAGSYSYGYNYNYLPPTQGYYQTPGCPSCFPQCQCYQNGSRYVTSQGYCPYWDEMDKGQQMRRDQWSERREATQTRDQDWMDKAQNWMGNEEKPRNP